MNLILSLLLFFSAVVVHEFSHAFVAYKLGDQTARRMGRLTLNPLAHIDPFGTVLLPLMLILMGSPVLFGYAKPVPVNFASLKNPKQDMIWVGFAGPAANFIFAVVLSWLLKTGLILTQPIAMMLESLLVLNVVLAVFNLMPLPPLDGSRILMGLLPLPLAMALASMERYGIIVLFGLIYLGVIDKIVWPVAALIIHFLTTLPFHA